MTRALAGPPDTRPPGHPTGPAAPPPPPPPADLAAALDSIDLLLRTAKVVTDRKLVTLDQGLVHQLAERLRLARRAVADLQTPARRDRTESPRLSSAAAQPGGPVQPPGADVQHWRCGRTHDRDLPCPPEIPGTGALVERITAGFTLPKPPEFSVGTALLTSLARRAD